MVIIPNLGAEQPRTNSNHLDALRPFVERVMGILVPDQEHELWDGRKLGASKVIEAYLPPALREELACHAVFAFINTPEVLGEAAKRGLGLVGSPDAIRYHRRDWLFQKQASQNCTWNAQSCCFNFDVTSREEALSFANDQIRRTPALQINRTWKPFLSASGSGRCAGSGPELRADEEQFILKTPSIGLVLEPWVDRVSDFSSQYWLTNSKVYWLSSTSQKVSPAGRYLGLKTTWHGSRAPSCQTGGLFETSHHDLVQELWLDGYRGPLGIDGFTYHTRGREMRRDACEINARLTMAHLLIAAHLARSTLRERSELALDLTPI